MKNFKPFKAPNDQVELEDIKYSVLSSYKLDGIRCIFYKGKMLSCSLKPIVNKQLRAKMKPLADYSKANNLILDGELYNHNIPFGLISSCVMTQDVTDKKAIKSWAKKCKERDIEITREEAMDDIKFWCFDAVQNDNFEELFVDRLDYVQGLFINFPELVVKVNQVLLNNKKEVTDMFEEALKDGYEGLILKDPNGRYKCGRGRVKEALIYKVKPYRTWDAEIIEVIQATKVDPNAEKTTNELGRSVTSKKKDDRILIEKASAFKVKYEGLDLKVVIAMTDPEKEEIWANKADYIGKMIEYKGMLVGAKDVPRHPVMLRFLDKESK